MESIHPDFSCAVAHTAHVQLLSAEWKDKVGLPTIALLPFVTVRRLGLPSFSWFVISIMDTRQNQCNTTEYYTALFSYSYTMFSNRPVDKVRSSFIYSRQRNVLRSLFPTTLSMLYTTPWQTIHASISPSFSERQKCLIKLYIKFC